MDGENFCSPFKLQHDRDLGDTANERRSAFPFRSKLRNGRLTSIQTLCTLAVPLCDGVLRRREPVLREADVADNRTAARLRRLRVTDELLPTSRAPSKWCVHDARALLRC